MTYVLICLMLALLIVIHEFGHLVAAKMVKIPIARFSVGFGPRLWGFKRGETEYWLSPVPLGGYVLPLTDEEGLARFSLAKRILFYLGGPLANTLVALLSISVLNIVSSGISFSTALIHPLTEVIKNAYHIITALPALFQQPENISGIVGIVALGGDYVDGNISRLITLAIILNLNLAVFNLLPLPPLDGGKIILLLLEKIHKPFARLQNPITVAGWALMICLLLYVTILDVGHLIMSPPI